MSNIITYLEEIKQGEDINLAPFEKEQIEAVLLHYIAKTERYERKLRQVDKKR